MWIIWIIALKCLESLHSSINMVYHFFLNLHLWIILASLRCKLFANCQWFLNELLSLVCLYLLMLSCSIFPPLIISLSEFGVKVNIPKIIFQYFYLINFLDEFGKDWMFGGIQKVNYEVWVSQIIFHSVALIYSTSLKWIIMWLGFVIVLNSF